MDEVFAKANLAYPCQNGVNVADSGVIWVVNLNTHKPHLIIVLEAC